MVPPRSLSDQVDNHAGHIPCHEPLEADVRRHMPSRPGESALHEAAHIAPGSVPALRRPDDAARRAWSLQQRQKSTAAVLGAFRDDPDPAVLEVLRRPGEPELQCPAAHPPAQPDPLDPASHPGGQPDPQLSRRTGNRALSARPDIIVHAGHLRDVLIILTIPPLCTPTSRPSTPAGERHARPRGARVTAGCGPPVITAVIAAAAGSAGS